MSDSETLNDRRRQLVDASRNLGAPVALTDFNDPENARHNMTVLEESAKTCERIAYEAVADVERLRGLLFDAWQQFAITLKDGIGAYRTDGGLSTLEDIKDELFGDDAPARVRPSLEARLGSR